MPETRGQVAGHGCDRDGIFVLLEGAVADRQREHVDQLLAGMPENLRAEDPVARLVDDDLRPGGILGQGL